MNESAHGFTRRIAAFALAAASITTSCASTPSDPAKAQAEARCDYESRLATGPRALTSGYAAAYQERLYYSCMSAAGY